MSLNNFVDGIFLVNLDKSTDRLEQSKLEFSSNKIEFERFSACSPNGGATYKDRVSGCRQSHIGIIKLAKARGYERVAVFEDDIELSERFNKRLHEIKDFIDKTEFSIFYFGGSHFKNQHEMIQSNISRVKATFTTHAYIMHKSAFDFVLSKENEEMPIDDIYVKNLQAQGKCYCIRPNIAYQRIGITTISLQNSDYKWIREGQ